VEKSSTYKMGMQVSCCNPTEIPKKVRYGQLRRRIGGIFRELCRHKGVELEEGNALPDDTQMLLSVPLKYCSDDNNVLKIKECDSYSSSNIENKGDAFWSLILGTRLLYKHSRLRRAPN
jgi:REP element-mobilizing transposase RayT